MKESTFINANKASWERLEVLLQLKGGNPDEVQQLFVKVSGDLSYARTFYSRRAVTAYLNDLINRVFDSMQTQKKFSIVGSFKRFYLKTHSQVIVKNRWAFALAYTLLLIGMIIGAVSTYGDAEFARSILGEHYISMTTENINAGDPMAVYKSANHVDMFLGITLNNIRVAFLTTVTGVFGGLGTFYVLIKNAIMVGVFQAFFAKQGLFVTSFLTIWIHGTIEIWSIGVAAVAGFIIGRGILLPGSYTRGVSMSNAAIEGLIIILGTIPMFLIAGFLEGFVTRLTDLPTMVKIAIIIASIGVILYVYCVLPIRYIKVSAFANKEESLFIDREINQDVVISDNQPFAEALAIYRQGFLNILAKAWLPVMLSLSVLFYVFSLDQQNHFSEDIILSSRLFSSYLLDLYGVNFLVLLILLVSFFLSLVCLLLFRPTTTLRQAARHFYSYAYVYVLPVAIMVILLHYSNSWWLNMLLILILPWAGMAYGMVNASRYDTYSISDYSIDVIVMYGYLGALFPSMIIVLGVVFISLSISNGFIGGMLVEMFSWLPLTQDPLLSSFFIRSLFSYGVILLILPCCMMIFHTRLRYAIRKYEAIDLKESMAQMSNL